jgi:carbamoyltransferase
MAKINVLAIQEWHNCTAALLQDGKIEAIVSEERFTRVKNQGGFPHHSIKWILKTYNLRPEDLDAVAICTERYVLFYPQGAEEDHAEPTQSILSKGFELGQRVYGKTEYAMPSLSKAMFKTKEILVDKKLEAKGRRLVIERLWKHFKIPEAKITFVNHHTCHAYAAYYGLSDKKENAAVLTLDGEGDNAASTVNVVKSGNMKKIASTWKYHSLGYVYSYTTAFLGMKPLEHEYKVMGLAPYASAKEAQYFMKTYDKVYKDIMWLDKKNPLTFNSKFPTNRMQYWLKEKAVGERFDNMAGAVQHFTEELAKEWVKNVVKKTGTGNIYAGGGVFMNVKMNMALSQMPEVKNIHVLPSCGDESNPIGGAYYVYLQLCKERKIKPDVQRVKDLYLGPSYDDEVEAYLNKPSIKKKYKIRPLDEKEVAQLIAKGEVVARSSGRMEFGARSLGNRAIIANPSDLKYVWEINEQIKMRDFWMPFAPTILKEREQDYIVNPKKIDADYMIMAFNSTELGRKELRAAMHQADFTLRPQMLREDWNPKYYKLIKEFENITGIGGVLNTSFNLHGKPIVATPKDAIEEVFMHSGLKHVIVGDFLVSKN